MDLVLYALALGWLTAAFAGYGIWLLVVAYRAADMRAWRATAALAGASVFSAAVFAIMAIRAVRAADWHISVIISGG